MGWRWNPRLSILTVVVLIIRYMKGNGFYKIPKKHKV